MQSEKGFSLVEMMITLAISAIIIGAAFGSYTIIQRNFEWQKDMKYISQSARNVIEMIQKDIRNAGFRFEANAAITDPVKIYNAGDCCDRIEIIYDETINKRVKKEIMFNKTYPYRSALSNSVKKHFIRWQNIFLIHYVMIFIIF